MQSTELYSFFSSKQATTTNSLEGFRGTLASEGVSGVAATLTTDSQREGTTSNYQSAGRSGHAGILNEKLIPLQVL